MNDLSWFIYLGSVVTKIHDISIALAIGGSVFIAGSIFVYAVSEGDAGGWPSIKQCGIVLGLFLLFAVLPGEGTLRLMAASELGQRAYQSQQIQGIVDPGLKVIQKWLEKQLAEDGNK